MTRHYISHLCAAALLSASFISSPLALAQSAAVEDEVIATGTIRGGDTAMGAFFSGDYATAEVEFAKNFRRIKRSEMLVRDNAMSASTSSFTAEVVAGPGSISGGGGANEVRSGSVQQSLGTIAGRAKRTGEGVISGTDLGFQKYMMAMSQLKLRKYSDSKENFKSALSLNKGIYDANLRLGLLELRGGNISLAKKSLMRLDGQVKRCRNVCEEKTELLAAKDTLASALNKIRS